MFDIYKIDLEYDVMKIMMDCLCLVTLIPRYKMLIIKNKKDKLCHMPAIVAFSNQTAVWQLENVTNAHMHVNLIANHRFYLFNH